MPPCEDQTQDGESTTATPDYVPAVGDVVEFEYYWEGELLKDDCKGLVFQTGMDICIASLFEGSTWEYNPASAEEQKKLRKIGYTDLVPTCSIEIVNAKAIAKAYFAPIKVGDRAKVARAEGGELSWYDGMKGYIGEISTVVDVSSYGVDLECSGYTFPIESVEKV